jgi:methionyl-tRNA formyltransferase
VRILLLGPPRFELVQYLESFGDEIITREEPLSADFDWLAAIDFIISYGYRHIIKREIIDQFWKRAINLHISLLPWNRGADPNLWSFLKNSPKGVTIHYLDYGIDTGDILAQREVGYEMNDTLRTSYDRLTRHIEELFREVWPDIRVGKLQAFPQQEGGSYHRLRDREKYAHLLTEGWDTPVLNLIGKAKEQK